MHPLGELASRGLDVVRLYVFAQGGMGQGATTEVIGEGDQSGELVIV